MLISLIIPCKDENARLDGLLADIAGQKVAFDTEIVRVNKVSPPGRARNKGANRSKGDILVFIDCDVRLADELFLANLIQPLLDRSIGLSGASVRLPPDADSFQRRYARQVPHCQGPLVEEITDIQIAPSAACAIYRELFFSVGGFNEEIVRGEDSVLSQDVRDKGFRVVLAPGSVCYHPQPRSLKELIAMNIRNGRGACFVDTYYPDLNLDVHPQGISYFSGKKTSGERMFRFVTGTAQSFFTGRILLLLSKAFYGIGYLQGLIEYRRIPLRWRRATQKS